MTINAYMIWYLLGIATGALIFNKNIRTKLINSIKEILNNNKKKNNKNETINEIDQGIE